MHTPYIKRSANACVMFVIQYNSPSLQRSRQIHTHVLSEVQIHIRYLFFNIIVQTLKKVGKYIPTFFIRWLRILKFIKRVQLRVTHIFHEGNQVANFIANANRVEGLVDFGFESLYC